MEPLSLQESFAQLYQRSDLGVALADENQIFDANDAALRMLGFTREELRENKIDWVALTPAEFAPMDERGLQQDRKSVV